MAETGTGRGHADLFVGGDINAAAGVEARMGAGRIFQYGLQSARRIGVLVSRIGFHAEEKSWRELTPPHDCYDRDDDSEQADETQQDCSDSPRLFARNRIGLVGPDDFHAMPLQSPGFSRPGLTVGRAWLRGGSTHAEKTTALRRKSGGSFSGISFDISRRGASSVSTAPDCRQ